MMVVLKLQFGYRCGLLSVEVVTLVDDKMHVLSDHLITQQPLGVKHNLEVNVLER
jgi:hypothetical protein